MPINAATLDRNYLNEFVTLRDTDYVDDIAVGSVASASDFATPSYSYTVDSNYLRNPLGIAIDGSNYYYRPYTLADMVDKTVYGCVDAKAQKEDEPQFPTQYIDKYLAGEIDFDTACDKTIDEMYKLIDEYVLKNRKKEE